MAEASEAERDFQQEADTYLERAVADLPPELAALALATLMNRTGTRLHNLARERSGATRDTPEWATWAGLVNASRGLLLQASTCRDLAARLAGRRR